MKIEIEVSNDTEGTDSPYWLILNPRQILRADVNELAETITGPFFSREEAEKHLQRRRYAYRKCALVYCMTGYHSGQYRKAYFNAKKESK